MNDGRIASDVMKVVWLRVALVADVLFLNKTTHVTGLKGLNNVISSYITNKCEVT